MGRVNAIINLKITLKITFFSWGGGYHLPNTQIYDAVGRLRKLRNIFPNYYTRSIVESFKKKKIDIECEDLIVISVI